MVKSKPSKISRLPTRTSLIADSTMFGIGMAAAGKKMHNHFLFYAFPRSIYAKIHAQKKPLCRICAQRSAYYGVRSCPEQGDNNL
jgi:hypothetical protein